MLQTLARNWWLVLAALVGLLEVGFGVALPFKEGVNQETVGGGALMFAAGLVILGGIAIRQRRSRVGGDIMIAVAAVPILIFFWMVFPLLMSLPVIVAASVDMAEARSLGRQGRPA